MCNMLKNPVKECLRAGKPSFGTWISIGHPDVTEMLSLAGFNWVLMDMEHAPLTVEVVHCLMQSCRDDGAVPMVRVPPNDPRAIQQSLDGGAYGVIVPQINSAEDARRAIAACLYAPKGTRGVGPRRATRYGLDWDAYLARANDFVLVGVQIETRQAIEKIDEILAVADIDVALIGLGDLAGSMGCLANRDIPEFHAALGTVCEACLRHHVVPGIAYVGDGAAARRYLKQGFRMIGIGEDDVLLTRAARQALAEAEGQDDAR